MNNICVIGSINMDVVLKVNRMAKVGETIFANDLKNIPGGKGSNQAIACSRMNANVSMIGKVGMDGNGDILVSKLKENNINTEYIFKDYKVSTGTAIITVDNEANNSIIVASGSNMTIAEEEINEASNIIKNSDIVIAQFEVPMKTILKGFEIAKGNNKITILNPAPAKKIDRELLKYTDIIIPNETEAFELTGLEVTDLDSAKKAANILMKEGIKCVIITLGCKGAAVITKEHSDIVPAYKVNAIDTTAAGDSFIGGFASKIDINNMSFENLKKSIKFGNMVSSIAVQREGAEPSIPYLEDVKKIYGEEL
ncbi:ribokinase [Clostridium botulinum]|uniref:ribokinase n=1 Tax=Clostridium botulinum TaxID=1491 RepID=UPI0004D38FD7|nr:ribokinase [Clostridium botulinum]KEI01080.1 ribokinase [Clostridium botulinum C/D str. BKT75002]KEI13441.1 ribokinase [Clostridium botulinum C/D str. BKT2873]KGM95163.1 ribokinase [Clostridium botulinum D str. CCUG 7971]MCD3352182.1 ribokinase [Clostridium botulinum D/C]MCD3361149.1 ribokinase [Clostridium botulinum D/C]